jgi:four helix bundle protein
MKSQGQTQNSNKGQREKVFDIRERTYNFSQRILDIVELLPKNYEIENIRKQLIKSGTSLGANTEEGDGAITRRDFINKIAIARKEAKETRFWLRIISGRYVDKNII